MEVNIKENWKSKFGINMLILLSICVRTIKIDFSKPKLVYNNDDMKGNTNLLG